MNGRKCSRRKAWATVRRTSAHGHNATCNAEAGIGGAATHGDATCNAKADIGAAAAGAHGHNATCNAKAGIGSAAAHGGGGGVRAQAAHWGEHAAPAPAVHGASAQQGTALQQPRDAAAR